MILRADGTPARPGPLFEIPAWVKDELRSLMTDRAKPLRRYGGAVVVLTDDRGVVVTRPLMGVGQTVTVRLPERFR